MTTPEAAPDAELLRIVRLIEGLKKECSSDPESPQAIRNGQYMSIATILRSYAMRASPAPAPQADEAMPPLPPTHYRVNPAPDAASLWSGARREVPAYTANQMRDYALAALRTRAEPQKVARLLTEVEIDGVIHRALQSTPSHVEGQPLTLLNIYRAIAREAIAEVNGIVIKE